MIVAFSVSVLLLLSWCDARCTRFLLEIKFSQFLRFYFLHRSILRRTEPLCANSCDIIYCIIML